MKVYAIVGAKVSESGGVPLTPILSSYGLKKTLAEAKEELTNVKNEMLASIDPEDLDIEESDMHLDISDGDIWYVFDILEREI